eukprot:c37137_g1_i1 orf=3-182(-)
MITAHHNLHYAYLLSVDDYNQPQPPLHLSNNKRPEIHSFTNFPGRDGGSSHRTEIGVCYL